MRTLAALALLTFPLLAGCAGPEHPRIMASFYPIEYLADRVAGGDVSVGVVVRPGTEPHDYEPTPSDMAKVTDADVVLLQGSQFEAWMDAARSGSPHARFVTVTDGILLHDNPDRGEA